MDLCTTLDQLSSCADPLIFLLLIFYAINIKCWLQLVVLSAELVA